MILIPSKLESQEQEFAEVNHKLNEHQFSLGGGWEYDGGSFDRALDGEARKVWLRLPFDVVGGNLDGESESNDAIIRFKQPFVLRHEYNEGLDPKAQPRAMGSLIDQFQDPINPDASVDAHWVDEAKQVLQQVERFLTSQS